MRRVHRQLSTEEQTRLRTALDARIPESAEIIGNLMRDMRLAAQMSQQEYADATGVAVRALTQVENGWGNPRLDTLEKLLAPFGYRVGIVRDGAPVEQSPDKEKPENRRFKSSEQGALFVARDGFNNWSDSGNVGVYACIVLPKQSVGFFRSRMAPILAEYSEHRLPGTDWGTPPDVYAEILPRLINVILELEPWILYSATRPTRTAIPNYPDSELLRRHPDSDLLIDFRSAGGIAFGRLLQKAAAFSEAAGIHTNVNIYAEEMPQWREPTNRVDDALKQILRLREIPPEQSISFFAEYRSAGRSTRLGAGPRGEDGRSAEVIMMRVHTRQSEIALAAHLVSRSLRQTLIKLPDDAPLNNSEAINDWELRTRVWGSDSQDPLDKLPR